MYHATNSRNRSCLRASRPASALVLAPSADTLLTETFLAASLFLACFLVALINAFDPFRDGAVIVRAVRLAMLSFVKKISHFLRAEVRD